MGARDVAGLTLDELLARAKTPGISVAVIHTFEIHWARGYGIADERRALVVALLAGLWLLSATPLLAPLAGPGQWGLAPPLLLVLLLWFGGTQRLRSA